MNAKDLIVVNNTKVFPARLLGHRYPSGGAVEVLLLRDLGESDWTALVRPGQRLKPGSWLTFGQTELRAQVVDVLPDGLRVLRFEHRGSFADVLDQLGQTPLPPYIRRPEGSTAADRDRYQTIYAEKRGAIAAPTAGLHFTPGVMSELKRREIQMTEITLHVGYGTFEPVRVKDVRDHRVSPEQVEVSAAAAEAVERTRDRGGRIVAVGTTTTRALESCADKSNALKASKHDADLTIIPGYRFRVVDALLTNFHLPQSSLLLLLSAFAGRELVLEAYRHAVAERYRFYSYGDCMLVV